MGERENGREKSGGEVTLYKRCEEPLEIEIGACHL